MVGGQNERGYEKEKTKTYRHTNILIRIKEEIFMKNTFVSVTTNIVVAGIYNWL